jgi:hypothetical protein
MEITERSNPLGNISLKVSIDLLGWLIVRANACFPASGSLAD